MEEIDDRSWSMKNIIVSVITPSYNSAAYIEETIRSVQQQTFTEWEMLIVDDCSSDETCEIVRRISQSDDRIKLFIQPQNMGAGAARTLGMRKASGQYIAYLDADDIWLPEKLEKQMAYLETHPEIELVHMVCFDACTKEYYDAALAGWEKNA